MRQYVVDSAQGRLILLATILASGLSFLAGTTVSIALPTIQAAFGTSISGIQWVLNAQLLALASLILIAGSLGDRFGRKRIFSYGILLFIFGSFLSGLSDTVGKLILFQALQGIGAALMIPGSLAIINSCFEESHRGRAIGLWAGLSGGMAALGPFLGGLLVETFGWQAVFYFNIPMGLIALFAAIKFVPETRIEKYRGLDLLGTLLIPAGLFGISFGFIRAPAAGWSDSLVLVALIGGALAAFLFILTENKVRHPIVPLRIFKKPLVAGANLATLLLYSALNGMIFFTVLNFQQVQNYSPIAAGLGLLPPILLITLLSGFFGGLADKIGPRMQMIAGPIIVAVGMGLMALPGVRVNYFTDFLPGLILFGVGMACVIAPLTKSALAVDEKYSGVASGVNNAASRIAALMAIAVLGAIMVSLFTSRLNEVVAASSLSEGNKSVILIQADKVGGISIPDDFGVESSNLAKEAIESSFVYGFRWVMIISAILALLSAVISYFVIPKRLDGI